LALAGGGKKYGANAPAKRSTRVPEQTSAANTTISPESPPLWQESEKSARAGRRDEPPRCDENDSGESVLPQRLECFRRRVSDSLH
jgi:hypothetical protein